MTAGPSDPGRADRRLGEAAAALCRLLDPWCRDTATAWASLPRRDGLLARWRSDPRTARALPVIAARLRGAGLLGGLSSEDRALAEAAHAWGQVRAAAIARVCAALARAAAASGARVLLCKAAALHGGLYPDPSARPAADVDAFVPGADVRGLHASLTREGFRAMPGAEARIAAYRVCPDPSLLDLEYVGPDEVHLEIKADPVAMGMPIARTDDLAERSRPAPCYAGLRIPSAEAMSLQQAFSAARRPIPDVLAYAELAATVAPGPVPLDTAWMLSRISGEGLYGVLRAVLEDVERLFPGAVPPALLARAGRPAGVVPRRTRAGAFGAPRHRMDAVATWASRGLSTRRRADFVRWVARRAFPPTPMLHALAEDARSSSLLLAARRALARWR